MKKKLLARIMSIALAAMLCLPPTTAFAEDNVASSGEETSIVTSVSKDDEIMDSAENPANGSEDISAEYPANGTEEISGDESTDESDENKAEEDANITDNTKDSEEDANISDSAAAEDVKDAKKKDMQIKENVETKFSEAGNTPATATPISLGTTYNGWITSSNDVDYYQFTIGSSGRVTLTASAYMNWIYYYIYDSSKNELWKRNPSWNSTSQLISTEESFDLTKGTYYFAVKRDGSNTGNYSFALNFSSANESFSETGNGINNFIYAASSINLNTTYRGQLAINDETDFYKFTLPSSGKITLSASAKMGWIYYYIYDSSGNELWKRNPSWNDTTKTITTSENIDLTKGTYYFAVKREGSHTGNYSFKLTYTNANESFSETGSGTNNTIPSANSILLNKGYRGQLALNDDVDFYKFTLKKSTKLKFASTAKVSEIEYYIYNASGNEIWNKWGYRNNTTGTISMSEEISLSAGTYYFSAKRCSSGSDYTGTYSFSLSDHTHKYKQVISKATTTSNGKKYKKCSTCGFTTGTSTIYAANKLTLSGTTYTYNGKTKTPSVKVKNSKGSTISSSNYTVSYSKGRKNVGTYTVKVTLKGSYYKGTLSKKFKIRPTSTALSSLSAKSKGFTAKWAKRTTQTTGYQIQYSTSKSFSNATLKTIGKNSTTKATYGGLKAKQRYYVRIRTYKSVSGTRYYSAWSSAKSIVTK